MLWVTTADSDLLEVDRVNVVDADAALVTTLEREASMQYLEQPVKDVWDDIASTHQVQIVDESNSEAAVSIFLHGVSLKSGLATILHGLDLICEAKGGSLLIRDYSD